MKKLPKEIILKNGINLVLDEKKHNGKNNLSDISWYQYKIVNNKELGIAYDNICLSLFRITESVRIEASKEIINDGVSKKETVRPHIDYKSGNIHPSKEYIENQNDFIKYSNWYYVMDLVHITPKNNWMMIFMYTKIAKDNQEPRCIRHAIIR